MSWDLKGELRLSGPCLKGKVRRLQHCVCEGAEGVSGEWKGVLQSWEEGSLKYTQRGRLRPDSIGSFSGIEDFQ